MFAGRRSGVDLDVYHALFAPDTAPCPRAAAGRRITTGKDWRQ
jgi:hypothetical protein